MSPRRPGPRKRPKVRPKRGSARCPNPSKRHYPDKQAALHAIAPSPNAPVRVYRCNCGNGWCHTSRPE